MQQRKPLRIELPKEEGLRLGRVGLIALAGFAIGLVWPRLAGVRLVPSVPAEKSESSSPELSGAPASAPASASATAPEPAVAASTGPTRVEEPFMVTSGEVTSCRDRGGKKLERCDPVDFDAVARGRIATLAACDAAKRARGLLSVGFDLDFEKDRVVGVQSGKSTTLPDGDVDALLTCLRQNLGEVSLAGIRHQHARYTVFYKVDFSAGGEKPDPTAPLESEIVPASGKATVAWDAALVRAGPSRDSPVVARILQGTRVTVSGRHGDWYRVKYDAKSDEGWVFRTAIGM